MSNRLRKSLAGTAFAAAIAVSAYAYAAVGPTGPGQFYRYYDDAGQLVGYQAIHCDGTREAWGTFTRNYADGIFICDPDPR